jgi:hypothetical protein
MLIPQQEDLVPGKNGFQEMISLRPFSTKIVAVVNGWVNGSAYPVLGLSQAIDKISQTDFADNQQIDVAFGALIGSRHRAMNKRELDQTLPGGKGIPENVGQPNRFRENALKISENGALRVRAKVNMTAFLTSQQNAGLDQRAEFALQTGRGRAQLPGQVAKKPPALGMEQGGREKVLTDFRPQSVQNLIVTHNA